MGIIGEPYPDLGETHEHQLIGSAAWEERKQYEADRKPKGHYSLHGHIANAVRDVCVTATGKELVRHINWRTVIAPLIERVQSPNHRFPTFVYNAAQLHCRDETATGKQIHHEIINYIEVTDALDRLEVDSETNHRRYLLAVVGKMSDEEIAALDDCSVQAVRSALSRARRFLAHQIRDAY